MDAKHAIIRLGLKALGATGLSRIMAPATRGIGVILMLHRVRPAEPKGFDPHAILEVTPAFLDVILTRLKSRGYALAALEEVPARLRQPGGPPFAAITFDDGYRDNAEHALPVLKRHGAPFTVFAVPGFADGAAPLWWLDLEQIAARRGSDDRERRRLFEGLMAEARSRSDLQAHVARLAAETGIDQAARSRALCLDWEGLRTLAADPLCAIGAHTLTHPILAALDERTAREEIARSKAILEERLGRPVRHFAYPVGDAGAAGPREFAMAWAAGFETAVTTRPGVLFPEHAAHPHALPRLSVNGLHQSVEAFDVLLSGAAFALANRFRRLNTG